MKYTIATRNFIDDHIILWKMRFKTREEAQSIVDRQNKIDEWYGKFYFTVEEVAC